MGEDLDTSFARKLYSPLRRQGSGKMMNELLRIPSDLSEDSSNSAPQLHTYARSPLRKQHSFGGDRYIPRRSEEDLFTHFSLLDEARPENAPPPDSKEDPRSAYSNLLKKSFQTPNSLARSKSNILPEPMHDRGGLFQYASPTSPHGVAPASPAKTPLAPLATSPSRANSWGGKGIAQDKAKQRKVSSVPYKVLDAPNLLDDFYLNLTDWSSTNLLAVALGAQVYLWNAYTGAVTKCYQCEGMEGGATAQHPETVSAVRWVTKGHFLAVGTSLGKVEIIDTKVCRKVRTMTGHTSRVGALCWNGSMLTSGSRDRMVINRDTTAPNHFTSMLVGHKQEVCGLKWSGDGRYLASGGNDNKLLLWSVTKSKPIHRYAEHSAAVKAIAWSPHESGVLVSGGGTADRTLRFWNVAMAESFNVIDTGSQVCNIGWSQNVNEIVSTHGYSQNQIVVWRYPTMQRLATLTGHTTRVLYLAISPDGQNIVTGAGDETLRFWHIWPGRKGRDERDTKGTLSLAGSQIR